MDRIYTTTNALYASLNEFWEGRALRRVVSVSLILVFLGSLALIELNRSVLDAPLPWFPYTSHFAAISLAFTLVLAVEVVSLIFVIPCSISRALGNQFEILSLILLRNAFKELSHFPEPIEVMGHLDSLYRILSDAGGALAVFALLGLYRWLLRRHKDAITDPIDLRRFVSIKRIVALALLASFILLAVYDIVQWIRIDRPYEFFAEFYTLLIFSDILIMLLSQRYLSTYQAVFRYSGFALSTVLIRLALTADPFYNSVIGAASVVFAVLVTLIYNRLFIVEEKDTRTEV